MKHTTEHGLILHLETPEQWWNYFIITITDMIVLRSSFDTWYVYILLRVYLQTVKLIKPSKRQIIGLLKEEHNAV